MVKPSSSDDQTRSLGVLSATTLASGLVKKALYDLDKRVVPWTKNGFAKPPCLAYAATVGVGKTGAIVLVVEEAVKRGLRIAIRTPTLALGRELLARIEKVVPGASGLWFGRDQPNPNSPAQKMCLRADDVRAAQFVGAEPRDVCGSRKRGYCRFHPDGGADLPCGYLGQNHGCKQVVIFAGDRMLELAPRKGMKRSKSWRPYTSTEPATGDLFYRLNVEAVSSSDLGDESATLGAVEGSPDFDLLILDETEPLSMLQGFEAPPVSLTRGDNERIIATFKNAADREILSCFLDLFQEQCRSVGVGGYLPPLKPGEYYQDIDPNLSSELTVDDGIAIHRSDLSTDDFIDILTTVREIAFANIPNPIGNDKFNRLAAKEIKDLNREASRVRSFLLNVGRVCEVMSIGLRNEVSDLRHLQVVSEGGEIYLRSKKPLSPHYDMIPTMIFDATLRVDLLKATFERLEVAYLCSAQDGDGVSRYQLRDVDITKNKLHGDGWTARLMLLSRLCCRMYGATGLIAPKFIREQLPTEDVDVRFSHFGALRGLNSFENVAALVVVSRTAIWPARAEEMAAVLTGKNISALPKGTGWYPNTKGVIRWRKDDRIGWPTRYVRHPDPTVEAVRASVTEDGLEQALGRGRNVRRSKARPLVEYLLTTTPTNRPVDGTFTIAEFKAATGWVGAFLEAGIWIGLGEKGVGGVIHAIVRGMAAQRPEPLYISLIGNPAFEGPETAADWRKKQIADNPEIGALTREVDKALGHGAGYVEVMCGAYPLHDFVPIQAKVRGSRYFAQLYVRTVAEQTAADALISLLGPFAEELEIRQPPTA